LLKKAGYDVTAVYLKIWLEDELSFLGNCPWEEDLQYVQQVCDMLGMPLQVLNLQREYHDMVVSYTIDQVRKGFTPNPDVLCNQHIKFGAAWNALSDSFDYIATGHYAQIRHKENGLAELHSAPDPVKDQTYFLSYLSQQQLSKVFFPIGTMSKCQVRALAHEVGLPTSVRKDSQGICFLGTIKFSEFIKEHLGEQKGMLIESETGNIVGEHNGFWYYTIGQRKGIGLSGGPWFVVAKDAPKNHVYVSRDYYSCHKKRRDFSITDINWLVSSAPSMGEYNDITVKLRHGPVQYNCAINVRSETNADVVLHTDDQGIAPGQFAVLYRGTHCLGAGVIAPLKGIVRSLEKERMIA
jgi:tRNA-specific 2-thiouridylase